MREQGQELLRACVQIGWTKARKNGALLDDFVAEASRCFSVPYFNTSPIIYWGPRPPIELQNTSGSTLLVTVHGHFLLPGTAVRVGSTILPASAVTTSSDSQTLTFSIAASDLIAADEASLISRELESSPIENSIDGQVKSSLTIDKVDLAPYSDALDMLTIHYTPPTGPGAPLEACAPLDGQPAETTKCIPPVPDYVVTVGGKTYGLADAPYLPTLPGSHQIRILVPAASVTDGSKITMQKLFWSKHHFYAEYYPTSSAILVTKIATTSSAKGIHLAILGGNLDQALLKYPAACDGCLVASSPNFATINLSEAQAANVKEIVLCRKGAGGQCDPAVVPIFVDVPKGDSGGAPTPKPPKPTTPPKPDKPTTPPKP